MANARLNINKNNRRLMKLFILTGDIVGLMEMIFVLNGPLFYVLRLHKQIAT